MKKTLAMVPRVALGTTTFLVLLAAASTPRPSSELVRASSVREARITAAAAMSVTHQDPERDTREAKKGEARERTKQEPREVEFLPTAFPPTLPDTEWHRGGWFTNDCMRCHETGVAEAPQLVHEGMPDILRTAKCRSCHVLIPGSKPRPREPEVGRFEPNAFPPMIPASERHRNVWLANDCLLCHDESRIGGAPMVKHEGLPPILLQAKCRTCHVQVRTVDATRPTRMR